MSTPTAPNGRPANGLLVQLSRGGVPSPRTEVTAGDPASGSQPVTIGEGRVVVIAGPCAVETEAQIVETACALRAAGAAMLRGGAFKPRTSPYSFQGLGEAGLRLLAAARAKSGLPIVTEVVEPGLVPVVAEYADILQVGARNMANFSLLKAVGRARKPVLLKRGMMATLEEYLLAAEYVLAEGNPAVILCERGIRTFETHTRNTLDLSAVPALKEMTHLPVLVDPSHGTGRRSLVIPMARAAIAAGADGLLVEVHPTPDASWTSDGSQSLTLEGFSALMHELEPLCRTLGKVLVRAEPLESPRAGVTG
ncbi:MAG TPA: 3-deoxy-7-phosphoheptulonate synthase [Limnochordia bacterium]